MRLPIKEIWSNFSCVNVTIVWMGVNTNYLTMVQIHGFNDNYQTNNV